VNAGPDVDRDVHRRRDTVQASPAARRWYVGSTVMFGTFHQEIARQRHREACLQARRFRLARAVRAERRARRAVEIAVRAHHRAGGDVGQQGIAVGR
jgi:hypothetical protein